MLGFGVQTDGGGLQLEKATSSLTKSPYFLSRKKKAGVRFAKVNHQAKGGGERYVIFFPSRNIWLPRKRRA